MSRILYHERREHWDKSHDYVQHYVEVEVRSWTCEGMTPDVVIEQRVMVDRELVVDWRDVYAHGEADAAFIRKGIEIFDKAVAAHPFFSQQDIDTFFSQ